TFLNNEVFQDLSGKDNVLRKIKRRKSSCVHRAKREKTRLKILTIINRNFRTFKNIGSLKESFSIKAIYQIRF
ncbi:hypothetical protein DVQ78_22150, partial [Yersinia enterocolitica]|nr:hypothetical protein [Yersinia enterocolitica]